MDPVSEGPTDGLGDDEAFGKRRQMRKLHRPPQASREREIIQHLRDPLLYSIDCQCRKEYSLPSLSGPTLVLSAEATKIAFVISEVQRALAMERDLA
jgi:hypothetical protein